MNIETYSFPILLTTDSRRTLHVALHHISLNWHTASEMVPEHKLKRHRERLVKRFNNKADALRKLELQRLLESK